MQYALTRENPAPPETIASRAIELVKVYGSGGAGFSRVSAYCMATTFGYRAVRTRPCSRWRARGVVGRRTASWLPQAW